MSWRSPRRSAGGSTRRWSRTSLEPRCCWTVPGRTEARHARRGRRRTGSGRLAQTSASPRRGCPAPGRAGGRAARRARASARLLADAWVVERLEDLPRDFAGVGVTRRGRVWFAGWGEVRQLSEGGTERVLARRNERDRLIVSVERAAQDEQSAKTSCDAALAELRGLEETRREADAALRESERTQTEAAEAVRRSQWLIGQRRAAPAQGPLAVRKAELEGELASERRQVERQAHEAEQRHVQIAALRAQLALDRELIPRTERLAAALTQTPRGRPEACLGARGRARRRPTGGRADDRRAAALRRAGGRDTGLAARRGRDRDGHRGRRSALARPDRRGRAWSCAASSSAWGCRPSVAGERRPRRRTTRQSSR